MGLSAPKNPEVWDVVWVSVDEESKAMVFLSLCELPCLQGMGCLLTVTATDMLFPVPTSGACKRLALMRWGVLSANLVKTQSVGRRLGVNNTGLE